MQFKVIKYFPKKLKIITLKNYALKTWFGFCRDMLTENKHRSDALEEERRRLEKAIQEVKTKLMASEAQSSKIYQSKRQSEDQAKEKVNRLSFYLTANAFIRYVCILSINVIFQLGTQKWNFTTRQSGTSSKNKYAKERTN